MMFRLDDWCVSSDLVFDYFTSPVTLFYHSLPFVHSLYCCTFRNKMSYCGRELIFLAEDAYYWANLSFCSQKCFKFCILLTIIRKWYTIVFNTCCTKMCNWAGLLGILFCYRAYTPSYWWASLVSQCPTGQLILQRCSKMHIYGDYIYYWWKNLASCTTQLN